MTLADKIVVLRAGKVEQVGAPLGLYEDPNNFFIAGFIVEHLVYAHSPSGSRIVRRSLQGGQPIAPTVHPSAALLFVANAQCLR